MFSKDGLIDYLEVMQMTGLAHLLPPPDMLPTADLAAIPESITSSLPTSPPENLVSEVVMRETTPLENVMPKKLSKKTKIEQLTLLADEVARCVRCKELARTRTQTVFGVGDPNAKLVFLGEAPGADEDRRGEPFVGRAGKLLDDIITKGMKIRREDVYICNILRCRPPDNRNPKPAEAECCREFLDRTLEIVDPEFICCLGTVAAQNLLQTEKTIGAMRGKILEYQDIKVVCTYHPAYLLRNPAAKKQTWEDIQILMREMGLPMGGH